MKLFYAGSARACVVALAIVFGVANHVSAAVIFVTDNLGNVWQYDNIADMGAQTSSSITGTKVRDIAAHGDAYKTDQDVTMALNTGLIYRITGAGDVIRYPNVMSYVHNVNATTVATAQFVGADAVNGLSYFPDGANHRFYSIIAGTTGNGGDIAVYNNLTRFLDANPNNFMTAANYTGATLTFYDPDGRPGTTVGNMSNAPKNVVTHYYQVPSNGRLEGFANLADYNAGTFNHVDITATPNAFGGTSSFKAIAAFAVPQGLAAIPEATSFLIWLGVACCTALIRHR